MIINPTSYSFIPPINMVPVTGFSVSTYRIDNGNLVYVQSLPVSSTGGLFTLFRDHALTNGMAGIEMKLSVKSVGYNADSPYVDGDTTFSFQPAPDPPSGVIIYA